MNFGIFFAVCEHHVHKARDVVVSAVDTVVALVCVLCVVCCVLCVVCCVLCVACCRFDMLRTLCDDFLYEFRKSSRLHETQTSVYLHTLSC